MLPLVCFNEPNPSVNLACNGLLLRAGHVEC
jgi:hypothetical protein